jgi:hypothetical protein
MPSLSEPQPRSLSKTPLFNRRRWSSIHAAPTRVGSILARLDIKRSSRVVDGSFCRCPCPGAAVASTSPPAQISALDTLLVGLGTALQPVFFTFAVEKSVRALAFTSLGA